MTLSLLKRMVTSIILVLMLSGCREKFDEPSIKDPIENPDSDGSQPDPETPESPDPETPDPEKPGPENPDPDPEPETPEPENPDPNPDPTPDPDPENPNPEVPDPSPDPDPEPNPDPEPEPEPVAGEVWARGVSRAGGWYDVNKKGDGRTEWGDAVMCWAASASNMLQWWLDNYVAAGNQLSAEVPQGPGKDYQLRIFEIFREQWNNMHGCQTDFGIRWYMTGDVRELSVAQGYAQPLEGFPGGFLSGIWPKVSAVMKDDYTADLQGYYGWNDGYEGNRMARFTELVVGAFKEGMAGLSIRAGYSSLHAVTAWGYELDANGLVSKLFITDSDDMLKQPASVERVPVLHEYKIEEKSASVGFYGGNYREFMTITDIYPLRAPGM